MENYFEKFADFDLRVFYFDFKEAEDSGMMKQTNDVMLAMAFYNANYKNIPSVAIQLDLFREISKRWINQDTSKVEAENEFIEDESFICQSCGSNITRYSCLQNYTIGSDGQACSYPICPVCESKV